MIKRVYHRVLLVVGVASLGFIAGPLRADDTPQAGPAQAPAPALAPDEKLASVAPENALPELKDALAKAMANAPRVIESGLYLESADVETKYARSSLLPSVNANVGAGAILETYDYGSTATQKAYTHERNIQALFYSAGVSQPLFHWGALKKNYQSSQLRKAVSERNLEEVRRTLALEVRRAYFNLISLSNSRELERLTLANLEYELESLKLQQADGFITATVVSVTQSKVDAQKTQMRRSEISFDAQWRAFRQLAGLAPDAIWTLPKDIPPLPADIGPSIESLSTDFGATLPNSVLNAEDQLRAEKLNYEIQKTRQRPKVGARASVSQENRTPDNTSLGPKQLVTSYGGYLDVNWNIFDGFYTQAAKKSSLIQTRRLKNQRDQAEYNARENLRTWVNDLRMNWDALQKAEESLKSYVAGLETFQKDYESGFAQKKLWDDAKLTAESMRISVNNQRADFHILLLNYLSLRGRDPAVRLGPAKAN